MNPKPTTRVAASESSTGETRATRSDAVQPPSGRQLLIALRADLLAPIEAMVGYSQLLADDTGDRPPEFQEDVAKLQLSAKRLYQFVKQKLNIASQSTGADLHTRLREVRHEIGNQLNHFLGYCQLMLLEEEENYFGALTDDLQRIRDYCGTCEVTLLHYKELNADDDHPAAEPTPRFAPPPLSGALTEPLDREPQPVQPATVLVADDNQVSREVLVRALQREGHHVMQAHDGREALDLVEQQEFDLVLLDFLMPRLNGYQVLQQLKASERLRHTPVMLVSALDAVRDVIPCIELGAEDFLTKPVDLSYFRARVNACLEKKRLREREFGQFFTPELARHFVRHPELLREGRAAEVTVLFCDIRGFSKISERLEPSETVEWLSDVMAVLSDCVIEHRGVLVDYIGDELMAMWGAPEQQPDHARLSCRAAVEMLARLPELSARWEPVTGAATSVGIGLNTGLAQVGNTGSHRKFKYGALGNTVNVASRVQGATKYLKTGLLVTGTTWQQLGPDFATRRLCQARLVNIDQAIDLHEVFACDQQHDLEQKRKYEQALQNFEERHFRLSAALLGNLLVDCPHDSASLMLMSRVVDALLHESDPFDPVWELPGK